MFKVNKVYITVVLYYRFISVFENIFVSTNEWTNKCTKLKITE